MTAQTAKYCLLLEASNLTDHGQLTKLLPWLVMWLLVNEVFWKPLTSTAVLPILAVDFGLA